MRRAITAITHGQNHCGLPDRIGAMSSYEGTTRRRPDIGGSSNCESPDGLSVVGFGTIDPRELSLTCWWLIGTHSVEADVAFNKATYGWTTDWRTGCAGSWSIRAVGTHEFGHDGGSSRANALGLTPKKAGGSNQSFESCW